MNLEKATVCCELTTQKLPCLHSILRTVGWSGTRHRWRNEMCNEPSPNLCFLCYSPAVPDSRLVTVLPPLARARPARVYGMYIIMSIMNSVFYQKNTGSGDLVEFPCRSAAECRFGAQNSAVGALAKPHSSN